MKATRLHEYGKAPVLEEISVPDFQPDEILVNVKACGMCRSDVQLIDGYFRKYAAIPTPITLGHEITGVVSKIGSIDLAIDKAATARIFDKTTSDLATLAQSGKPLFGIQESNAGKVVIFGGGVPVVLDGAIVGAVGASAGTVEQDIAVAEAAITALSH